MKIIKRVPPDGGYGWVVAFAMALNSFIYIPMMHCFGLIFKDIFKELHFAAYQGSLIINLHASFGMLTGLLNGVLLKIFGYRKIAFLAAILYFIGITSTAFATNFQEFLFFYGLIASLGVGMSRSSYNLALNTYFKKRRSQAMSFAFTFTGLGSVLIPQFINLLMKFYTSDGVILIFGGICSHFFFTAILLQPVKWHMKDVELCEESNCDEVVIVNDKKSFLKNLVIFFDLDLLKDPIFINILIGIGFAVFSELNFLVLTPFILNDFGFSTNQIATFLSTTGLADIASRLLAPYIGNYLKSSPRHMFLLTLIVLILLRLIFLLTTNFYILLAASTGLGVAKGIRKVFMGLIIPSHVNLEKLPSASGMEMMCNGFCILTGGSILGVIRDWTGSYSTCIIIMNFFTFLTIFLWSLEFFILKNKRLKASDLQDIQDNISLNTL